MVRGMVVGSSTCDQVPLALASLSFMSPPAVGLQKGKLARYLILISAFTVPHVAIVSYMDRRQHV